MCSKALAATPAALSQSLTWLSMSSPACSRFQSPVEAEVLRGGIGRRVSRNDSCSSQFVGMSFSDIVMSIGESDLL